MTSHRLNRWARPAAAALMTYLLCKPLATAAPVEPAQFEPLRQQIKPADGEQKWTTIPWMTSLWDARKRAAAEGKPILLWEMDGHPLGCV